MEKTILKVNKTKQDLIFERSLKFISGVAKDRIKKIIDENPGRVIDGKEYPIWVRKEMNRAYQQAERGFQ